MNSNKAETDTTKAGGSSTTPPVEQEYYIVPEFDEANAVPSLYKKLIPFFSTIVLGILTAGKKAVGSILDGFVDYLIWFYKTRLTVQWNEIDVNLRGKFGVSNKVMDELKATYERSSWLALPWYLYIYFISLMGNVYGMVMNIKASSVQDSNKDNRITLPSPESVLLSLIRKEITVPQAEDLLGRLGISQDVANVIKGALNQYPSPDMVAVALNRNIIDQGESEALFNKLNVTPESRKVIKGLTEQYTSPETIITALIKGEITGDVADDLLDAMNIKVEARKAIVGAIKQIAPDLVLMQNVWRGKLSKQDYMQQLSRRGYDDDQQGFYANLLDVIPPVQDIIRMAVREAFTEEKVKKFQYDEDFPAVFAEWSKKQGLSEDWAKKYWRAHWELPSVQMVFEMLHRGLIDQRTVEEFLVIADYPKYWRELLVKISYNPLTRVDVRRMYEVGTFDKIPGMTAEQAVLRSYKDLGYNDENARLMTQFTIDLYGEERKKLAEGKVLKLYKQGLIDRNETRNLLKNLKYREEYIDFIIMSTDYDKEGELIDALLYKLKSLYLAGRYTKSDVLNEISRELSVTIDTQILFRTWDFERDAIRRLPSAKDVLTWIETGVIKQETGVKRLVELGYSEQDARNYVQQLTGWVQPGGTA